MHARQRCLRAWALVALNPSNRQPALDAADLHYIHSLQVQAGPCALLHQVKRQLTKPLRLGNESLLPQRLGCVGRVELGAVVQGCSDSLAQARLFLPPDESVSSLVSSRKGPAPG